tara:strand:+ start:5968 stop:6294 length:327 start_codon:yes stop_codon:yes gene_type:complete
VLQYKIKGLQILEAAEREGVEIERQKGRFLVDAATDSEEAETVWDVPVDEDPSSSLETMCMKLVAVFREDVAVDLISNFARQTEEPGLEIVASGTVLVSASPLPMTRA